VACAALGESPVRPSHQCGTLTPGGSSSASPPIDCGNPCGKSGQTAQSRRGDLTVRNCTCNLHLGI